MTTKSITLTVPRCGLLFEVYMTVCASWSQNRKWNQLLHGIQNDNDPNMEALSDDDQNQLIQDNSNGFIGWLLFTCSSIGIHGRRQLFYHTFVSHYFGLSRQGIDTLSKYGFTQSLRSFDMIRSEIHMNYQTVIGYSPTYTYITYIYIYICIYIY